MKLIVGLGNPGSEYRGTRHNVGFEAVDALARRLGWLAAGDQFERVARSAFDGLTLDGTVCAAEGVQKVMLLKPMTFMNNSGRSVRAATAFYRLPLEDLMIVLDDMALPPGRLRIRPEGSDGGHNGLRDIQQALGTTRYPRLRIGIGPPPPPVDARAYVLSRFTPEERRAIEPALARCAEALEMWMTKGITAAMNAFNAERAV